MLKVVFFDEKNSVQSIHLGQNRVRLCLILVTGIGDRQTEPDILTHFEVMFSE